MKKGKLRELEVEHLGRGWVFRCTGEYPYEKIVDFLLRENRDSPSHFTLMVVSGFKAGCDLINLPAEAGSLTKGIAKSWVIENWGKWIYPECSVEDVEAFRLVDNPICKG